ncbi:tetratricopeptide repeat protein [Thalassospira alkalitolerans]|uniref:tetratricopeptide repeat protein n=1 Tax=Thalassospira alkalitolerans TaxID=1293890 RepID=UPI0030EDC3D0
MPNSILVGRRRRGVSALILGAVTLTCAIFANSFPALADYTNGYKAYQAGNYEMARAQWRLAAQEDDPRAQYALGLMYYRGLAGPLDYRQAANWFTLAARANHPNAIYYLGLMHFNGWGLRYDQFSATDYFKRALHANPGNADAAFLIGEQYFHGRGAKQNYVEAAHYYQIAAEKGMHAAQFMLGAMTERGWGVEPDYADAYYWLRRSALGPITLPPGVELDMDPVTAIANLEPKLRPEEIRRVDKRLQELPMGQVAP